MSERTLLLLGFACLWLLAFGAAALLLRRAGRQRRVRSRFDLARGIPRRMPDPAITTARSLPVAVLRALGRCIARSGVLSARTMADLRATLAAAGFRGAEGLWLFIGVKVTLFAGLPLVGFLSLGGHLPPRLRVAALAALAAGGLLAPDMVLRRLRAAHLERLQRDLPDALDLMVICAQAGLGLEAAISRVGEEMRSTHREIARELDQTAGELQITADSRVALQALGQRTGLDSLKRLASTLSQSLHYGTPLSAAMRMLAAELRQESLTRLEERATRLPVLLTLPMVVFILPCVFIIVGGPAVIRILHALGH